MPVPSVAPLLLLDVASAATLRVPEDHATIALAVGAAAVGDVIEVGPGVFAGFDVNAGRDLTVRSTGGAVATTLTGGADLVHVNGGTLTLEGFTLVPTGIRAIRVRNGGAITGRDLAMTGLALSSDGAFARIETGSQGTFESTSVSALALGNGRGAFHVDGSLVLRDVTVADVTANDGPAVWVANGTALTLDGATLRGNRATNANGGGAVVVRGGTVVIENGATFTANSAGRGGALNATGATSVDIRDATFADNVASGGGGALWLDTVPSVAVVRATFCANEATAGSGGAVYASGVGAGSATWRNSVFVENSASGDGGGLYLVNGTATVENNDFVGGSASAGGAIRSWTQTLTLRNNVVAYTGAGNGLSRSGGTVLGTYDAWYQNLAAHAAGYTLDATDLVDDEPDYTLYSADGDCSNDDLRPQATSPIVDRGDPAVLDRDGSRSDMGSFGGPDAAVVVVDVDADDDGVLAADDCDDADATVGAATEWFSDGDGDGVGGASAGTWCDAPADTTDTTGDCDDTDADVHPDATETCNGVDDDCDGTTDGADATDPSTWYADADGDGYGTGAGTVACDGPAGSVPQAGDCDDANADAWPGAEETCDDTADLDCDGSLPSDDADGDGFSACDECDDTDPDRFPDADDVPDDGIDQNCSGEDATATHAGGPGECACDAPSRPTLGWLAAGLGVILARRRGTRR